MEVLQTVWRKVVHVPLVPVMTQREQWEQQQQQ
jgi:hypothetical protein